MDPELERRIERVCQEAVTLAPGQQAEWLEKACAGDPELLSQVKKRVVGVTHQLPALRAGAYRLVRELGRGGMGAVYLGERDDGEYEAQVAVKLIRSGTDTEVFHSRFKRERQALARLQHPNIARIFDSGSTVHGQPYIVMELVDGVPITAYVKEKKLNVDQILELYLEVCRAVSHAHQKLVVHRDLKPGNILVQQDGTPKLLDFGICKIIEESPRGSDTLTGEHLMTPEYASPEQVRGQAVNEASDIYSLGAVLYELLTGRPPHIISRVTPAALVAICGEAVAPPSRATDDPVRAAEITGLLDAVVLRALEKNPQRRYPTVERFAEDLRRVISRETSPAQTTSWFPRWTQAAVPRFLLACALISVLCGLSWAWWQRSQVQARKTQSMAVKQRADKLFDLQTRASVTEARALAEAAVKLDPDNGPAHNLLAEIYAIMLFQHWVEDREAMEKMAYREAKLAVQMEPNTESSWAALINFSLTAHLDLAGALQACRESLTARPHGLDILAACARAQMLAGNIEISRLLVKELRAAQPEGPEKWIYEASANFRFGDAEATRECCRKIFEMFPNHIWCTVFRAQFASMEGRREEALGMARVFDTEENRGRPDLLRVLTFLAARAGDQAYVKELVERVKRIGPQRNVMATEAMASLGRGEFDKALDLLERTLLDGDLLAAEVLVNRVTSKEMIGHRRREAILERFRAGVRH